MRRPRYIAKVHLRVLRYGSPLASQNAYSSEIRVISLESFTSFRTDRFFHSLSFSYLYLSLLLLMLHLGFFISEISSKPPLPFIITRICWLSAGTKYQNTDREPT